jgi:hypothetical protein
MSERQFTDEEVAEIFKRASEEEHLAPVAAEGKGMTLPALQEIAREVGLSPESITRAARALDPTAGTSSQKFLGLPLGVGRTVQLDHALSDREWDLLVADLRATFQARGKVTSDGSFRQWTNGNLQALVEPTPTGYRLRLKTMSANSRALMTLGLAGVGVAAATSIAMGIAGTLNPGVVSDVGFMATLGLGMFGLGALRVPGWARRRRDQMDEIASRLAITTKPKLPELPSVSGEPPTSR